MIVLSKFLIKIAAIAIAEHSSDFLNREVGPFEQSDRPFHPLLKENFRKGFACFPTQQSGNVVRVVGKMLRDVL